MANIPPVSSFLETPLAKFIVRMLDFNVILQESECSELCDLIIIMIIYYRPLELSGEKLIDTENKLNEILLQIKKYNTIETLKGPADNILISLFRIAEKLLSTRPSFLPKIPTETIEYIYFSCLFPLRQNIAEINNYKCKSNKSRQAAYQLLYSATAKQDEAILYLYKECITPLAAKLKELNVWSYSAERQEKSASGFVGIKNLGCICYMISMIQQFYMISPFRNAILAVTDNKPIILNEYGIDDNLLHQLQSLFGFLTLSLRRDLNPSSFCFSFKEQDGRPINPMMQHDSHEFLNIFFERIERQLKGTSYNFLLQSLFGGKSCSQVVCKSCGNINSTYEDYFTLSLDIKNLKTIFEALNRFISGSEVSDYFCEKCKKRGEVTKRTLLSSLPNILIVHLQRFAFNFDTLINEKVHTRLEFPNALNMLQYTEEGIESQEIEKQREKVAKVASKSEHTVEKEEKLNEEIKDVKQNKHKIKENDYYQYKLVGVVVHNGNAEAGHYYSFINVSRGDNEKEASNFLQSEKDRWVEFNDSNISEFNFSRIEAECFGGVSEESAALLEEIGESAKFMGDRSMSAYMLLYERKQKAMIPEVIDKNLMVSDNDVIINSTNCDINAVFPIEEKKDQRIIWQGSNNEKYLMHKFYQVQHHVPETIVDEVNKDNIQSIFERLVYSKEFIVFFCDSYSNGCLIENFKTIEIKQDMYQLLHLLCDKFFIELFPHLNLSKISSLGPIGDCLSKLVSSNLDISQAILRDCLVMPSKAMEALIKCPEFQVRRYIGKTLLAAYIKVFNCEEGIFTQTKQISEMSEDGKEGIRVEPAAITRNFFDMCVKRFDIELQANWTKFKQFFELLKNIVIAGDKMLISYSYHLDLPFILLNFFLEKQSPYYSPNATKIYEMGNQAQSPDFSDLMELLNLLILKGSIYHKDMRETDEPSNLIIKENVLKCLYVDDLIPKYLRCNGKMEQISKMITKLCYKCKLYSKKICALILRAINELDYNRVAQFWPLLSDIIQIPDSLQTLRIEWILGFQQPILKEYFGLAGIRRIIEDVNYYYSPLSDITNNYTLLCRLWLSKTADPNLSLLTIKIIFLLADISPVFYDYLKAIPSPSYTYRQYTDWIKSYLDLFKIELESLKPEEKQLINAVFNEALLYFKKYLARLEKEGWISPQNYMIGYTLQMKELKEKELLFNGLRIVQTEFITEIYPSSPTGNSNTALPSVYLEK